VIEVVCAVIVEDGRVLLCQRPEGAHLAGLWEFPGGKVEEGEARSAALVREIREELGCLVKVGRALAPVEHHYPEVSIRLWPFFCRVVEGEAQALEHAALAWVERGALFGFSLAAADQAVARLLLE
jgi:8-oxo-dGTP diphosphatase